MRGLGFEGLNDLTLHPVYSQSQTKEAASVVSLESLTYHAKSIFSCNNSTDDFRENGGPTVNDRNRERMDSGSPSMEKGPLTYMSQRNAIESRAFGNARNR